jgi:hypothetical protein
MSKPLFMVYCGYLLIAMIDFHARYTESKACSCLIFGMFFVEGLPAISKE